MRKSCLQGTWPRTNHMKVDAWERTPSDWLLRNDEANLFEAQSASTLAKKKHYLGSVLAGEDVPTDIENLGTHDTLFSKVGKLLVL